MRYELKMLTKHFAAIEGALNKGAHVEQACFLLCSISTGKDRTTLLVREVVTLLPEHFDIQKIDFISVNSSQMGKITDMAEQKGLSVCMVHTHPGAKDIVYFSEADNRGNARSFRYFNLRLEQALNSCLVFGGDLDVVCGRVYLSKDNWVPISKISVLGAVPSSLKTCVEIADDQIEIAPTFDRQMKLLGKEGQRMLQKMRIAIIGLGGIGSVINMLLTHSGIEEIILIDEDLVEDTNRPRIIGVREIDIGSLKVKVAERYISEFNKQCRPISIGKKIESIQVEKVLLDADVIICCTDSTKSRAHLDQICHQHYIPVMDLGVQFVADSKSGQLKSEVGKVNFIMPGTPCMACVGDVTAKLLEREVGPKELRDAKIADGYILGSDEKEPAMMMFNAEVASRGMQILIGYFTGLVPYQPDRYEKFSFLGLQRAEHHYVLSKSSKVGCLNCDEASSPYFGAGDKYPLLFRED